MKFNETNPMPYKLAKRLKDCGFPQERSPLDQGAKDMMTLIAGDWVHYPTRWELLERLNRKQGWVDRIVYMFKDRVAGEIEVEMCNLAKEWIDDKAMKDWIM